MMLSRLFVRPAAVVAVLLVVSATVFTTACSSSGSSSSTFTSKNIVVSDVWARESAMSADTGAVYLKIENTSSTIDKLFAASVSQNFAKSASIHETVMADGTTASTMPMESTSSSTMGSGSSAMMTMKEVSSVTIPANGSVAFEPGGYHIMLVGLTEPLKNGQKFEVNLGFLNGGVIKVIATVKSS
jgi:copper(I)-binding protein